MAVSLASSTGACSPVSPIMGRVCHAQVSNAPLTDTSPIIATAALVAMRFSFLVVTVGMA
jgi:hypothetical protein